MRKFLSSIWYPLLVSVILGGTAAAVFWILEPGDEVVRSSAVTSAFQDYYIGWAACGVLGLLVFLEIGILNLIRRIVRLRKVQWLHPVIILIAVVPWLIFGWHLTYNEPRFTPIGRAIISFVGEPMYAGSVIAVIVTLVLAIPLLIPSRSSRKKK